MGDRGDNYTDVLTTLKQECDELQTALDRELEVSERAIAADRYGAFAEIPNRVDDMGGELPQEDRLPHTVCEWGWLQGEDCGEPDAENRPDPTVLDGASGSRSPTVEVDWDIESLIDHPLWNFRGSTESVSPDPTGDQRPEPYFLSNGREWKDWLPTQARRNDLEWRFTGGEKEEGPTNASPTEGFTRPYRKRRGDERRLAKTFEKIRRRIEGETSFATERQQQRVLPSGGNSSSGGPFERVGSTGLSS